MYFQELAIYQNLMVWLVVVGIGCFTFLTGTATTFKFLGVLFIRFGEKIQQTQDYFRAQVNQMVVGSLEKSGDREMERANAQGHPVLE